MMAAVLRSTIKIMASFLFDFIVPVILYFWKPFPNNRKNNNSMLSSDDTDSQAWRNVLTAKKRLALRKNVQRFKYVYFLDEALW